MQFDNSKRPRNRFSIDGLWNQWKTVGKAKPFADLRQSSYLRCLVSCDHLLVVIPPFRPISSDLETSIGMFCADKKLVTAILLNSIPHIFRLISLVSRAVGCSRIRLEGRLGRASKPIGNCQSLVQCRNLTVGSRNTQHLTPGGNRRIRTQYR